MPKTSDKVRETLAYYRRHGSPPPDFEDCLDEVIEFDNGERVRFGSMTSDDLRRYADEERRAAVGALAGKPSTN